MHLKFWEKHIYNSPKLWVTEKMGGTHVRLKAEGCALLSTPPQDVFGTFPYFEKLLDKNLKKYILQR